MSLLVKLQKVVQHVKLLVKKHVNVVQKVGRHVRLIVKVHVRHVWLFVILLVKHLANVVWKDVRHVRMLVKNHVRMINVMNARLPVRYVTLSKVIVPRINRGLLNT